MALKLSNTFEEIPTKLIREMEAAGWTGKVSRKGHAIMRAPDGQTTCSVSPKVGAAFRAANLGMEFRRWQREQEAAAASQEAPEAPRPVEWLPWPVMPPRPLAAEPEPTVDCTECGKPFRTLQAMSVHRVRAHVRVNCPICAGAFSPGNLPRHQLTHDEATLPEDEARRALYLARQEVARLRDELTVWQGLAEETEENLVNLLGTGNRSTR